jgi:hypothetical protein
MHGDDLATHIMGVSRRASFSATKKAKGVRAVQRILERRSLRYSCRDTRLLTEALAVTRPEAVVLEVTKQRSIRHYPQIRSAMKEYAVAPIRTGGVASRHGGPRDT